MKKKTIKKTWLKAHPWDETLVIAVMVVSALCVLILLASYITSSGQAAKLPYNQATSESVLSMINSATVGNGSSKMICNVECTRRGEVCIVAYAGDKLVDCGARITGDYTCLCSSPLRTVGAIPGIIKERLTVNKLANLCANVNCGRNGYCVKSTGRGSCLPKKVDGVVCAESKECLSDVCRGTAIQKICAGAPKD